MSANQDSFNDNLPESPGGNPVGLWEIYLILAYILLFTILILYSLVKVWPPIPEKEKTENINVSSTTGSNTAGGSSNSNGNQNTNQGTSVGNMNANRGGNMNGNSNVAAGGNANAGSAGNINTSTNANTLAANTNTNANARAGTNTNGNSNTITAKGGAVPASEICLDTKGNVRQGMAPVSFLWIQDACIYDEDRLLLIVALTGALGALVHALRSLSWYIGQRRLYRSWTAMYFLLPFLGAATALVFYLVIRGGFFSSTVMVKDTNPFGFAALAALIGMFTDQALQRLKTVAENILMPAPVGNEHAPPVSGLTITAINPKAGPAAGGTTVTITGTGFMNGTSITFGNLPATNVVVNSDTSVTALTPAHTVGIVDVEVNNPNNQKAMLKGGYTYQ